MQDLQKTLEQLLDYVKGMWIKKRYVMICSWLICPPGFIFVASMHDVYESKARVYVDTRSILQPLLRGLAIQTNPDQEIAMIVKTLLSRANLETIARESDLDILTTDKAEYQKLINSLADDIKVDSAGRDNLFTISYSNKNAAMAKTVVQETLELFVEGTLGNSRKDTDTASKFLDEQIADYEKRLSMAEQRLADFKRTYSDVLPLQGTFYQNLQTIEDSYEQTRLTIRETEQQIKALTGESKSSASDEFSVRRSDAIPSITTRYDERIKTLEETLDQLKLKYTELHPDVIQTTDLLKNLKEERQKEVDSYLAQTDGAGNLNALSTDLRLEVSRLQSLIASLKVREANYQEKIAALREKIDLVPQIEAQATALNRDYGITKEKHEELLSRRESAALSQKADVSSEDLQFKVIEPPFTPLQPSGPHRIALYIAVVFIGFGSGLAIAFLVSQLTPVLVRGNQLTAMTNYPLLGVVSHLNKVHLGKVHRTRLLVFALSSSVILLMCGALIAAELANINLFVRFFQ